MDLAWTIGVLCFAGMAAGAGISFAGMSAAVIISPILVAFLGIDPYLAIGIALTCDVFASATSAYTFGKNGNLDIRNGLIMMASVLVFTVVGSIISSFVPAASLGSLILIVTLMLGIKFLVRPVTATKESMSETSPRKRALQSVVLGSLAGIICGFVGAGGGMMMLFVLTTVLGYELKTALGTSLFIMAFSTLIGAGSHFIIGGMPDLLVTAVCAGFTLIWAKIAAIFANKASQKTLNRATGGILVAEALIVLAFKYLL